jgi:hypothetical protein
VYKLNMATALGVVQEQVSLFANEGSRDVDIEVLATDRRVRDSVVRSVDRLGVVNHAAYTGLDAVSVSRPSAGMAPWHTQQRAESRRPGVADTTRTLHR